jgi:hypothetical protein
VSLAYIVMDPDVPSERIEEFVGRLPAAISEAIRLNAKKDSGNLADSIEVNLEGRRVIRISSSLPYAKAVQEGTSPRVMWNLINRVVPLKLPGGLTVFRKVSLKSILSGKWRYPGTAGLQFVEKGAQRAKAAMSGPVGFIIKKTPTMVIDIG